MSSVSTHYEDRIFIIGRVMSTYLTMLVVVLNLLLSPSFAVAGGFMDSGEVVAGDRPNNQWLQYDSSCLPRTQQAWEHCHFVEKTHWGYYSWPRY